MVESVQKWSSRGISLSLQTSDKTRLGIDVPFGERLLISYLEYSFLERILIIFCDLKNNSFISQELKAQVFSLMAVRGSHCKDISPLGGTSKGSFCSDPFLQPCPTAAPAETRKKCHIAVGGLMGQEAACKKLDQLKRNNLDWCNQREVLRMAWNLICLSSSRAKEDSEAFPLSFSGSAQNTCLAEAS